MKLEHDSDETITRKGAELEAMLNEKTMIERQHFDLKEKYNHLAQEQIRIEEENNSMIDLKEKKMEEVWSSLQESRHKNQQLEELVQTVKEKLGNDLKVLANEKAELEERHSDLKNQNFCLEKEWSRDLEEKESIIKMKEKELREVRTSLQEVISQNQDFEEEARIIREGLESQLEALHNEKAEIEQHHHDQMKKHNLIVSKHCAALNEKDSTINMTKKELEEVRLLWQKSVIKNKDIEDSIQHLREELGTRLETLHSEKEEIEAQKNDLKTKNIMLTRENTHLNSKFKEIEKELEEGTSEHQKLEEEMNILREGHT
eukprot:6971682-Ditylum_brightwellii.AAC.1